MPIFIGEQKMIKLNMGCGNNHKPQNEGWVNIDKYEPADIVLDLEDITFCHPDDKIDPVWVYISWPWPDNSVDEVLFHHSLEHMGLMVDGFFHIMREIYRVCKRDAHVTITVPHPRHDDFINDPTHVRVITPMIMELFSKKNNELWAKNGNPNTPLALQLGVDFEFEKNGCVAKLDARFDGYPEEEVRKAMISQVNVIKQYTLTLKVVK